MTTRTSLLFALLLSVSDVLSIEKRGDDVEIQSLMTLVQQQAATIQQQAATMEVMKTQLTGLQTSVQQQSGAISELNTRLHTQVAFMAHASSGNITASAFPLKFDTLLTNLGGAYSPTSGVFTAPVSGLYVFYAQLMNHGQTSGVHWAIDLQGNTICMNALESGNYYDKSSCLTTARVEKGQQVFVRTAEGMTVELQGSWWCSFAGFLLYPA